MRRRVEPQLRLPLATMRRSTRPSTWKRLGDELAAAPVGAAPKHRAAAERDGAVAGARARALDARASSPCSAIASSPSRQVDALEEVARAEPAAVDLAGVLGRAEAPADARAGAQHRRRGASPAGTQVPQAPRLATRTSSTPSIGASGRGPGRAAASCAPTPPPPHAERLAGERLGEVPDAVLRIEAEAQVGEAERGCVADLVGHAQVAAAALDHDVGARTRGALRTSMRPPTTRSPPQPNSGCSRASSGATGTGPARPAPRAPAARRPASRSGVQRSAAPGSCRRPGCDLDARRRRRS